MAGYQQGFQQAYQQNYAQPYQAPQSMVLVPVQNEQVVNTYLVGAGNTVALIDFNGGTLWLKSTAVNGVPQPIRKFKMEEIIEQPPQTAPVNGVTREEFETLSGKFDALSKNINQLIADLGGKKDV